MSGPYSGPYGYGPLPQSATGAPMPRQVPTSRYIDHHRDVGMQPRPLCPDPGLESLVRAMACAIREARPVITMLPTSDIPWRGIPFLSEDRVIINGSTIAAVDLGAAAATSAEGLRTHIAETAGFSTLAQYTVPNGQIAVVDQFAVEVDEGGYFRTADEPAGPVCLAQVCVNDQPVPQMTQFLLGVKSRIPTPVRIALVVPENQTVSLRGRSRDPYMWHLFESFMYGWLVNPNDSESDTLGGLLDVKCGYRK